MSRQPYVSDAQKQADSQALHTSPACTNALAKARKRRFGSGYESSAPGSNSYCSIFHGGQLGLFGYEIPRAGPSDMVSERKTS